MAHRGEPASNHRVEGIGVFVRVRPTSAQGDNTGDHPQQVVEVDEGGTCICLRNNEQPAKAIKCAFDRVFGPESGQQDIFTGLVPALDTVLKGFNACVLAYGQTGSGKTHTLIGPGGGTKLPDLETEWGIIPRAVQFLFDRLSVASEEDETYAYSVTCSFLQIYNENLVDLLQQGGVGRSRTSLQIREESGGGRGRGAASIRRRRPKGDGGDGGGAGADSGRGGSVQTRGLHASRRVFVNGLSSFRVGGAQDVLRYVSLGAANRRVRATQHNEASSRSHAVLQLTVEVQSGGGGGSGDDGDGGGGSSDGGGGDSGGADGSHVTYRQAKLSLVDLAGSEKMDPDARLSKGHFNELRNINQSLSTLGNVVSALSEKGRTHVPYRDSKLTRLLQDSLGGNTRTTIIACVNPASGQTNETLNTLQFADRAKKVMVRLRANEVVDDRVLLVRAEAEIVRLKTLLRAALDSAIGRDDADESLEKPTNKSPLWANRIRVESTSADIKGGVGGDNLGVAGLSCKNLDNPEAMSSQAVPRGVGSPRDTRDEAAASVATAAATTAATAAATAAQRRHAAKLMAENERLRENNARLRADVQSLLQSNKKLKRRRQAGRSGIAVGRGAPPFSPPVDWSARYAYAAADARRRRPASTSSPLRRSALPPRARSVSPGARSSSSSSVRKRLPAFRRRKFGGQGDEGEGTPVEDFLSPDEVRALVGDEAAVVPTTPRNQEEAEEVTQLDMFRRELEKQASADEAMGHREGKARDGALTESSDGADNAYTEALLVRESQRLEDLMFEAQERERSRLRDERGRLTAARSERLALEAQLARLAELAATADIAGTANLEGTAELAESAELAGTTADPAELADSMAPVPAAVTAGAVPAVPTLSLVEDAPQAVKALEQPRANNRDQSGGNAAVRKLESELPVDRVQGPRSSSGWADPSTVGVDTATTATTEVRGAGGREKGDHGYGEGNPADVLGARASARRLVPASSIPERRQTGRITPISARRKPSHQRPSTSGGPTGRTRSRRAHRWAGGSRSPVRSRATTLEPAFARERSGRGGGQRREEQQQAEATAGGPATLAAASAAKIKALQATSPLASPSQPRKVQGLRSVGRDFDWQGGGGDRGDLQAEGGSATKGSLAYGVADLGLKLKVVGYDSRRRMHRCLYDATGEKQWHDLANKRFEVAAGQNGVISRGAESAPPPPTSAPSLLLPPASPSKP